MARLPIEQANEECRILLGAMEGAEEARWLEGKADESCVVLQAQVKDGTLQLFRPDRADPLRVTRLVNMPEDRLELPPDWAALVSSGRPWVIAGQLDNAAKLQLMELAHRLKRDIRLASNVPGWLARQLLIRREAGSLAVRIDGSLEALDLRAVAEELIAALPARRGVEIELGHHEDSHAAITTWTAAAKAGAYRDKHVMFVICSDVANQHELDELAREALREGARSVTLSLGKIDVAAFLLAVCHWPENSTATPQQQLVEAYDAIHARVKRALEEGGQVADLVRAVTPEQALPGFDTKVMDALLGKIANCARGMGGLEFEQDKINKCIERLLPVLERGGRSFVTIASVTTTYDQVTEHG